MPTIYDECSPQEIYLKALSRIKVYTGLKDLSLIEKVALHRIAENALERCLGIKDPENQFSPVTDSVAIFLDEYYGVPTGEQRDVSFLSNVRGRMIRKSGYDLLGEYFQRKQEEMHLP